ncbi:unnamed protein product, partial [Medioppia subpectinata]
ESDKSSLGLPFPNLPYYIDGDLKLSQSLAILRHLGRKHGLVAPDEAGRARQEVVEQQLEDIRLALFMVIMADDWEAKRADYSTGTLEPQLDLLVKYLGANNWLTGGQLSYVDFLAYETLDWLKRFTPDTIGKFPTVGQYLDRFEALPAIKTYQSSGDYKQWPLFGPIVKWGSQ